MYCLVHLQEMDAHVKRTKFYWDCYCHGHVWNTLAEDWDMDHNAFTIRELDE